MKFGQPGDTAALDMDYQLRGKLALSLSDLRLESVPAQPDVEDAADRQPGAPGQGRGADSARLWESGRTRHGVLETRDKELGGKITVLVAEGEGHFPVPKPVVDFILSPAIGAPPGRRSMYAPGSKVYPL